MKMQLTNIQNYPTVTEALKAFTSVFTREVSSDFDSWTDFAKWCDEPALVLPDWITPGKWTWIKMSWLELNKSSDKHTTTKLLRCRTITDDIVEFTNGYKIKTVDLMTSPVISSIAKVSPNMCRTAPVVIKPWTLADADKQMTSASRLFARLNSIRLSQIDSVSKTYGAKYPTVTLSTEEELTTEQLSKDAETVDNLPCGNVVPFVFNETR